MPKLTIDGIEIEVEPGITVLQACEQLGIEIPRFCYHERLSIAGNCRMCLVDMERAPKPVASCAMPVGDGMVIRTNTEKVQKMRKSVMEFLLINHPLDCPICDQGGECDLQDQSMAFGADTSRYDLNKRAVKDKYMGPLIKTIMTRCIHCTRCIRFATEVAGVPELGATGRGEHMEVGTYIEKALTSELSGNVVDLCPVGALTNAPYAYSARSWELKKTESVDVLDALGSNIRVDSRGPQVMRVLPRVNDDVNEEWISDKTRQAVDGLLRQRLDRPYIRKNGRLEAVTWDAAFAAIKTKLDGIAGEKVGAIAGDLVDCEAMTVLKDLMSALGSKNIDCRQDGTQLSAGERGGYIFNSGVAGIDEADAILIVGANPRVECPVLNARIRARYLRRGVEIAVIGEPEDLTYGYKHIGIGPDSLQAVIDGKDDFRKVLEKAERPMIIVGQGALARDDGAAVWAACKTLAEATGVISSDWNGFNVLHTAAARVGGLDLGLVPGDGGMDVKSMTSGSLEVLYLLGADEIDTDGLGDTFVIYQGHHGDRGAHLADVVLPGTAYTEKNATYVNTEGRVQDGYLAVFPPGEAKEDWKILRALSEVLGKTLPMNTIEDVRARMIEINSVFETRDSQEAGPVGGATPLGTMTSDAFASPIKNFYMTDPISRASETMAKCTEILGGLKDDKGMTGTDG